MSEQAGTSGAVIRERQAALASSQAALADADRTLAEALAEAHRAMRAGAARLDAIAAELDRAVSAGGDLAVDTPLGAREFRRFLVAKQREIADTVVVARELARAKTAVLQDLLTNYGDLAG